MRHEAYPTASLHLLHGLWSASCPGCGFELCRSRDQARAERAAARRRCPVCYPATEEGPTYRGLRLLGPLAGFHRAIDRLRWDTVRTPSHTDPLVDPASPPEAESGQAGLFGSPTD
jgi:hypothetical protein